MLGVSVVLLFYISGAHAEGFKPIFFMHGIEGTSHSSLPQFLFLTVPIFQIIIAQVTDRGNWKLDREIGYDIEIPYF